MMKKNYTKPYIAKIVFDYTQIVAASGEESQGEIDPGIDDPVDPIDFDFFSVDNSDNVMDNWSNDAGEEVE